MGSPRTLTRNRISGLATLPVLVLVLAISATTAFGAECRHCDEDVCQCDLETSSAEPVICTGDASCTCESLACKLVAYQSTSSLPSTDSDNTPVAGTSVGTELRVETLHRNELAFQTIAPHNETQLAHPMTEGAFGIDAPIRDDFYSTRSCNCGQSDAQCQCDGRSTQEYHGGSEDQCQCGQCISGGLCNLGGSCFGNRSGDNDMSNIGCVGLIPQWYANGSVLIMNRVTKSSNVLMQDTTNPIRQLNADAFDFGWQGGLDLAIKRIRWDEKEFEVRFFGLEEMSASTSVATNGLVEVFSDPPLFAPDVSRIDARYTSDLYGIEANWHFVTYLPFKYIAGFRYLGFDDDLSAVLTTNANPILYRTVTRNDLYGAQVGIRSVPDCAILDCHWLTWSAKAGIYGNDASQKSVFTGALGQRADDTADSTAFVGEVELGLRYPLTQCFTLEGGYRLLILERVAVGSDQLEKLNFFDGTGSDDHGNAIFHGASVGITFQH